MEFNQLPEGYEGPQRRRTNFASPQEKLAYDADNLIALAKEILGKEEVSVSDALNLATRNDDDLETVRKAIAIRLKTRPDFAEAGLIAAENIKRELTPEQQEELLARLKARFEANMNRHTGIAWSEVQAKLEASPAKMWSLNEMERTGGEPDVVDYDEKNNEYIFNDCSAESPEGRRYTCYDLVGQKVAENEGYKPNGNAMDMATAMGIKVLTQAQYEKLQQLGIFELHSNIWIKTPPAMRKTGRTLCGNRNNDIVYITPANPHDHFGRLAFRGALRV